MRTVALIVLLAIASCAFNRQRQQEIVDKVNKLRTTWKAAVYPRDIKPLLGTLRDGNEVQLPLKTFDKIRDDLPEEYDPRKEHPECDSLSEIRDQAKCGSCWAFGAAETMTDRLCLHSKGQIHTRVSPLELITCCGSCGYGCQGGYPSAAFSYWKSRGIPSGGLYGDKNSCKPYFLPECDDHMHKCHDYAETPDCENKCIDEYPKTVDEDRTFATSAYSIRGERSIMQELIENGPVEGAFDVYEDFGNYESGVYQHVTGSYLGGHAIKILGWGVTPEGVKYWLIANSWNSRWGENGYFRMLRGEDECGIESGAVAGMPRID